MAPRKKKIEAHTSAPLELPTVTAAPDPVKHLLDALYAMAMEGNTTAAKLWLDYHFRGNGGDSGGVKTEDVLRLIRESA